MPAHSVPAGPAAAARDFTAVYLEHHAACQRQALRIVRDRQIAEDVVQDVFTMLWQTSGGTYRPDQGPLGTWLKSVVHHKAVDAVRRAEARRRLYAHLTAPIDPHGGASVVHDTVWVVLRAQEVLEALTALSPAQREVLTLAYHQGLSQTQIATRIGIPVGTVKSRTRAGLLRLRATLTSLDLVEPTRHPRGTVPMATLSVRAGGNG